MASLQELLAASALITTCERICASGILPERDEQSLRCLIVKACNAFAIPTLAERVVQIDHDPEYLRTVDVVCAEMGRT